MLVAGEVKLIDFGKIWVLYSLEFTALLYIL